MGSFIGHVIPGSIFVLIGMWWTINAMWIYAKNLRKEDQELSSISKYFKSTTWFTVPVKKLRNIPIEPIVIMTFTVVGILLELSRTSRWLVVDKNGEFINLNNFAHITMYSAFLIWSTVEVLQYYSILELPNGSEHVFGSIAVFIEGVLFYSHLDGRPKLDQHLHVMLYVVIFALAFVLALEVWMKMSFMLLVARIYLTLLQGTWFFQIAHSLYSSKPWKDSEANQRFVAIGFTWHALCILLLLTISFMIVSCRVRGCRFYRKRRQDINRKNFDEEGESVTTSLIMKQDLELH